jgi:hypothetical protein
MKYPVFKNSQDFLEYVLLFLYDRLICNGSEHVSLLDYSDFGCTEDRVAAYNNWISHGKLDKEIIENWLREHREEALDFKDRWHVDFHPKPVLWRDRLKTVYFTKQLEEAFLFENYIANLLKDRFDMEIGAFMDAHGQYDLGENALGIEIKNDKLVHKTGNLYIEYQEKSNADNHSFVSSGILKNDNTRYFLIGTQERFYILHKKRLLEIYDQAQRGLLRGRVRLVHIATSKGMLLPLQYFRQDCISLEHMAIQLKT